jgi:hypothetical protein
LDEILSSAAGILGSFLLEESRFNIEGNISINY